MLIGHPIRRDRMRQQREQFPSAYFSLPAPATKKNIQAEGNGISMMDINPKETATASGKNLTSEETDQPIDIMVGSGRATTTKQQKLQ